MAGADAAVRPHRVASRWPCRVVLCLMPTADGGRRKEGGIGLWVTRSGVGRSHGDSATGGRTVLAQAQAQEHGDVGGRLANFLLVIGVGTLGRRGVWTAGDSDTRHAKTRIFRARSAGSVAALARARCLAGVLIRKRVAGRVGCVGGPCGCAWRLAHVRCADDVCGDLFVLHVQFVAVDSTRACSFCAYLALLLYKVYQTQDVGAHDTV